MNSIDAIRECDDQRVINCWKFLPILEANGWENYFIEPFVTLPNCKVLQPRKFHQKVWSRLVNINTMNFLNKYIYTLWSSQWTFELFMQRELVSVFRCQYNWKGNLTNWRMEGWSLSQFLSTLDKECQCLVFSWSHTIPSDQNFVIHEFRKKSKPLKLFHHTFPNSKCKLIKKLCTIIFVLALLNRPKLKVLN